MRRSTIISLILFLILAGIFWYTRQPENVISAALAGTATPTTQSLGYLVEPYSQTVKKITVQKASGATITLSLNGTEWAAKNDNIELKPVDQQAVESAATQVQDLRILSELDAQPNPADFGLSDANAHIITVEFASGTSLSVRIGKLTVTGSGYYVQRQDQPQKILIISKLSLDALLALPEQPPLVETPTNTPESTSTPSQ